MQNGPDALQGAILSYVVSLVGIFVFSLIVNALAPTFAGSKDGVQALKVVAYSATSSLVIGGVATLVPWLGGLMTLGAAIYGIYLLYLGLPATMKCPPEKAGAYTAVAVLVSIVAAAILWSVVGRGIWGSMAGGLPGRASTEDVRIDPDSPLGKIEQMGKRMESAGKQLEEAQKSGDSKAQGEALGAVQSKLSAAHADLRAKTEEADGLKADLLKAREQREEAQRLLGEARVALTDMRSRAEEERKASAEKLALLQEARTQLSDQFKALAADILEEKSKSFSEANRASLGTLIDPLKVQLADF